MVLFLDKLAGKLSGFWYQRITLPAIRSRMKHCGENVQIGKRSYITCQHVSIGNNAYLGPSTTILSTIAQVVIGNDVMFGPGVTIITGNHRTDLVGRTMRSVTNEEKRPEDDQDVFIEDDVWVGANVTVLKGVTIGMGSVIAAGSVVTKSVPPFSIAAGVPAYVVKKRFSEEEIQKHLQILSNASQV